MKRILCALGVSLIGLQALAGNVDDNLKKFEAVLQKAPREQDQQKGLEPLEESSEMLSVLKENIAKNDLNGAMETLGQEWDQLSEEGKKAAGDLSIALSKEQETRFDATVAQIEAAMKHATDAVKKAKTAADLDAVLEELDSARAFKDILAKNPPRVVIRGADARLPQKVRRAFPRPAPSLGVKAYFGWERFDRTYEFVSDWQEYLAAKAAGYEDRAREIARNLAKAPTRLLPRSELLARAYEVTKPAVDPKAPETPPAFPAPKQ
ncbi:MAG: hypothetical protein PHQ12_01490 [Chthoniobacteraceae bacterium]|nr:hypothetical protein [Chthoniobacteraceae bacterium]